MGMQSVLRLVYPPACIACGGVVGEDFALCPSCWRDTPFLSGVTCDKCGAGLPGGNLGEVALCDDCLNVPRPWVRGRAVVDYAGKGREMVLSLKHSDRMELARPMGAWMARHAAPLIGAGMVVVPVPLHRLRLLKRRYNQSALLAGVIARQAGIAHVPDALLRRRRTPAQSGDREARAANLAGAFAVHPRHLRRIVGRRVLLVDDVMTSGATLSAATEVLMAAGAAEVSVIVFARVAKDR